MYFPYEEIERVLGYAFRDKALLKEALTHSTYANAHGGKDNERLEYLGDAVLQLVVTEWQYKDDERADEGELTRERQKLVCGEALDDAVENLNLQKYLLIEGGRANVGKKTVSSIFEAVAAAIYLDGGYDEAKKFILRYAVFQKLNACQNPKGKLQEFLQAQGKKLPVYTCEKEGKDNAPIFRCRAQADGQTAYGEGKSKKQAEQTAADNLLKVLSANQTRKK
jgi:ribonuclease-3